MTAFRMTALVFAVLICAGCASARPSKLTLNFRQVPRGEGNPPTPKLDVDHADLGPVCELQCYETGPFQHGDAVKNSDGSVVFTYHSGDMTATTTFRTIGDDRVEARVLVKGPLDELKKVNYLGPCLQFQRSKDFTRQGPLQEFAKRCFIYTMRGPVMLLDTARGKSTNFKPDAPQNNPPVVQWYLPVERMHPGSIWGSVGAAGDRPIIGCIAVTSRDGKWLAAYAARDNLNIGQLFMPCIHVLPDVKRGLDEKAGTISYKEMIYVMPNDPERLYEAFREDFPAKPGTFELAAKGDELTLRPAGEGVEPLTLKIDPAAGEWQSKWWGTFIREGEKSRAWATPHDDVLELCVAFEPGAAPERVGVKLAGAGWKEKSVRGDARQWVTEDGKRTAVLIWEGAGAPAESEPGGSLAVRGKIIIAPTEGLDVNRRARWAQMDWEHAKPYRAPISDDKR